MHQITKLEDSEPLLLSQAWLSERESGFQPGEVRIGWEPEGFRIRATLQDRDVYNPERGFNERFFLQGDAFEWFVQPVGTDVYWEFHIGPDAQLYQIRFPSKSHFDRVRSTGIPKEWRITTATLDAQTQKEAKFWEIHAFLPVSMLEIPRLEEKSLWKMSFCRYDYNREPEHLLLSSTSPLKALDFHRIHEWHEFMLC